MSETTPAVRRPYLIMNRGAGTTERVGAALRRRMETETELREAEGPEDARRLAARAADTPGARIIAAGGDGTIHGVLNGIGARLGDVELAVLPLGTGNDLARSMNVPLNDLDAALSLALGGTARPIDVVRASSAGESRLFVNMCYGGFGGRVADQVNGETKSRWGLIAYWLRLAEQLLSFPEYSVRVIVGEREIRARLHGVLVANARFLGGGVAAAPQAELDDGRCDVILVPAGEVWDVLGASIELLAGTLDQSHRIARLKPRALRIEAEPELAYTMDGEAAPVGPLAFTVLPHALRVVCGDGSPA